MSAENLNQEQKSPGINFNVHNIFVKDISFEAPNTPQVFKSDWIPKMDFDVEMSRNKLEEGMYEVILGISVKVNILPNKEAAQDKTISGETAFIIEIKQAGVFRLDGAISSEQIDYVLATAAPNILFPYAREAVTNLVLKGGFPQLVLPPINFESMYQQHLAQQQAAAAENKEETLIQ